jgi:hypothetical protein
MEWFAVLWLMLQGPVAAALIIGLFWATLAHPERISSSFRFRLSALCLGAAVVASVVIPLALVIHFPDGGQSNRRGILGETLYVCAAPPILTMLAVYLGLDSVMGKRE